jgi:hypothetical protein
MVCFEGLVLGESVFSKVIAFKTGISLEVRIHIAERRTAQASRQFESQPSIAGIQAGDEDKAEDESEETSSQYGPSPLWPIHVSIIKQNIGERQASIVNDNWMKHNIGMDKRVRSIIVLGIGYFCLIIPAFSDSVPSEKGRLETFLYLSLDSGAEAVNYQHDFPLDFSSALPGAHGFQTLTIERKWGPGIRGGLSYFITDSFGLKLNLAYSRHKLGGENSPYMTHMEYVVYLPPEDVETRVTDDRSTEWMPTDGRFESLALSLNIQYRFPLSTRATGAVSAGPGLVCSFGRFSCLGYTNVWTQPFGIPWLDDYLLMMKLPATWEPCLNVDFEISLQLSRLVSLAARVAYLASKNALIVPAIDKIVSYDTLDEVIPVTYNAMISDLSFSPLELDPSALSLSAGLKLHF